jgi:hypothetical protein
MTSMEQTLLGKWYSLIYVAYISILHYTGQRYIKLTDTIGAYFRLNEARKRISTNWKEWRWLQWLPQPTSSVGWSYFNCSPKLPRLKRFPNLLSALFDRGDWLFYKSLIPASCWGIAGMQFVRKECLKQTTDVIQLVKSIAGEQERKKK